MEGVDKSSVFENASIDASESVNESCIDTNQTSLNVSHSDNLPNSVVDSSISVANTEFTRLKTRFYGNEDPQQSTTKSFAILCVIFLVSILLLLVVYINFPQLQPDEKQFVKVPKNIDDAKMLGSVLFKYKDRYYLQVLIAYFTVYVFLQSFAIPGSIFLSILSGFLFPFPVALFLVCLCSATGASFCYLLSYLVGRRLVWRYIPDRAIEWSSHVERHRQHLLNYIIFLRITPFLPNWFINIVSPVINVPLHIFFIGTFIGVAPPSFVAIHAGTTLQQLTSAGETLSWQSMCFLAVLAVVSLLPVVFRKQLKNKFD